MLYLRLIEDQGVVVAKFAFCKAGGIAGAKSAPPQQLEVCANSTRIGGLAIPFLAATVAVIRRFNEGVVLFATKGESLVLLARHLLDSLGRIFFDPSLFNAEIEERNDSLVLIVACGRRSGPRMDPSPERRNIELRQENNRGRLSSTPSRHPVESEFVLLPGGFRTVEPRNLFQKFLSCCGDFHLRVMPLDFGFELSP